MLDKRRRAVPIGALSAILILNSLFALADGGSPASGAAPRPPAPAGSAPGLVATVSPGPVAARAPSARSGSVAAGSGFAVTAPRAGVLRNADALPASAAPGQIRVAGGPVTARYNFDGGVSRPIADPSGRFRLRPLGQNGGRLRLVPQNGGLAVDYPDRCKLPRERDCPRAILEGYRDDNLNPGRRAVRYGASILMTHADLADGANVVQKGYSVGGVSQFKLQVDHRRGHPSCVIVGQRSQIYRAEPALDVADGRWHHLECRRTPTRLILLVDGTVRSWVAVPPLLSIANAEPLRIGGKGAAPGNDQFAGAIDNVFVSIAA